MPKITAAEARKLSEPSIQDHVNTVYSLIRKAAKSKNRQVKLHDDFWTREGYSGSANYKAAIKILEEDGYKINFFYEERQFGLVDMYTIVEW